jgi:hypothetical protein
MKSVNDGLERKEAKLALAYFKVLLFLNISKL